MCKFMHVFCHFVIKFKLNKYGSKEKSEDKKEAEGALVKVISLSDKVSKRNIIHKNKASNLKSQVAKSVAALA